MATIEVYSPSSHSQTVDVPATIEAKADVTNYGGAWGYARMRLTGGPYPFGFIEYGDIVGIRPGLSENVSATYPLSNRHQGVRLLVEARLERVTPYGSSISVIGEDHLNFRIYVRLPWDDDD